MNPMRNACIALSIAGAVAGCVGPQIKLSTEPPGNIDRAKGRDISARACGFQLFQLIPLNTNERHENAYDELRSKAGIDHIGAVSVTEEWYYGFIGSVYCTTFNAKAYPLAGP